jgi:hypothetical protein
MRAMFGWWFLRLKLICCQKKQCSMADKFKRTGQVISKIYQQRFQNKVLYNIMLSAGDHLHRDLIVGDVGLFCLQSQLQRWLKIDGQEKLPGRRTHTHGLLFLISQDANARDIVSAIRTEYVAVVVVRALIYNNSRGCHALISKPTPYLRLSICIVIRR